MLVEAIGIFRCNWAKTCEAFPKADILLSPPTLLSPQSPDNTSCRETRRSERRAKMPLLSRGRGSALAIPP